MQRARSHGRAGRRRPGHGSVAGAGAHQHRTRRDARRDALEHDREHDGRERSDAHPGADLRRTASPVHGAGARVDASSDAEPQRQPKPPATPPPPAPTGTDAYESQILALVNAQRSAAGLRPLAAQACADGFAEPWSPHMAAEGRLSHQSLGPVLSRCGARTAAENVGMNSSASPADMVAGFMSSPPHRANILNASYTGIGIGAYRDARGVWWVTQDFLG